jgi:hypothetical protein
LGLLSLSIMPWNTAVAMMPERGDLIAIQEGRDVLAEAFES